MRLRRCGNDVVVADQHSSTFLSHVQSQRDIQRPLILLQLCRGYSISSICDHAKTLVAVLSPARLEYRTRLGNQGDVSISFIP